jgi:hypothetical protein
MSGICPSSTTPFSVFAARWSIALHHCIEYRAVMFSITIVLSAIVIESDAALEIFALAC